MKTYICTKIIHAVPAKMVNGWPWPDGLPMPAVKEVTDPMDGEAHHRGAIEEGYLWVSDVDDLYPQFMKTEDFEAMCRPADSMAFGRKCLINIASAAKFSSDRTIRQYAEEIWHIKPTQY